MAKLKGIKIRLHEQTVSPGRANCLLAHLAEKVFVTFGESFCFFPKKKTEVSGIVLRKDYQLRAKPTYFNRQRRPLILVMGGSTGSHSINLLVETLLPKLTLQFQVVHQTGENEFNDYQRLKKQETAWYKPVKYLMPKEIGYYYHEASLIISRSGANTFFELIILQKPAILIPLPWAANNEQKQQAQILEKAKCAYLFDQSDSAVNLYTLISKAYKQKDKLKNNYQNLKNYAQLIKPAEIFVKQILS